MTCKDCVHYEVCAYDNATTEYSHLCAFVKPKADFVEVVRCKDCKRRNTANCALWCATMNDSIYIREHGVEFWCAFGERKESD